MTYIWKTKKWIITISEDEKIFKKSFEISEETKNELQSDNWIENKKAYINKYKELVNDLINNIWN